jgi:hypothetical protein
MSHKYLNKLGIKSTEYCIFNSEEKKDDRIKRFLKQRKKYGFDERETWSMDYTLACWVYSHFMWYKKHCIVDLKYHTFEIPKWNKKKKKVCKHKTIKVNQLEAINLVLENLKNYISKEDFCLEECNQLEYALKIMSVIMPTMWW